MKDNRSISHYYKIKARDDWLQLKAACNLIRRNQIDEAFVIYQDVLQSNLERYFPPSSEAWEMKISQDEPSINWACVYLGDFYLIRSGKWKDWLDLASEIFNHPDFSKLTDNCKSQLFMYKGWADLFSGRLIKDVILDQENALNELFLNDTAKSLHHNVLAYAYQQLRIPDKAFYHIELAMKLLNELDEPFYKLRVKEILASTYYFLNNFNETYYDNALNIYREIEMVVIENQQLIERRRLSYNIAWTLAEMEKLDLAWSYFTKGIEIITYFEEQYGNEYEIRLEYEMALSQYGQGYILGRKGDYQGAIRLLSDAASTFYFLKADLLTAVCLQLTAAYHEKLGNLETALNYAERSLSTQRKVDKPVQLYHSLRRVTKLYYKNDKWREFEEHFNEFFVLKMELGK